MLSPPLERICEGFSRMDYDGEEFTQHPLQGSSSTMCFFYNFTIQ